MMNITLLWNICVRIIFLYYNSHKKLKHPNKNIFHYFHLMTSCNSSSNRIAILLLFIKQPVVFNCRAFYEFDVTHLTMFMTCSARKGLGQYTCLKL